MTTLTILNRHLPSWDEFNALSSSKKKELKNVWYDLVQLNCRKQDIAKIGYQGKSLAIKIVCHYPSRKVAVKTDNMCIRLITGALQDIVFGAEDWVHVKYINLESWVDKPDPRIVTTISYV